MKDRYVVYWQTGMNIHHYFSTYKEAADYLLNNHFSNGFIAYVVAKANTGIEEYLNKEFCKIIPTHRGCMVAEKGKI